MDPILQACTGLSANICCWQMMHTILAGHLDWCGLLLHGFNA